MSPAPLGVLVVDDSDLLRSLVSHYLDGEHDLQVVASVATGAEAVRAVLVASPDVVLLDHDLPDGAGSATLRELRRRCPKARIVVFSTSDQVRQEALELGADEVVIKTSPFHEVADVLRTC